MAEAGHPAGQGSPSIEMELDGQAERPSLGTSSASSTVSYYESISDELDANSAPFQLVQNRKRRKASTSSASSDKTVKTMNRTDPHLTVIVRPKAPDKVIATINPKKIQEKLDMTAPDGVILVRPNRRLNVLAIDTRNRDATKALLALTTLDGIAVLAYEPLPRESAAGVIYEVPADLTEVEPQLEVRTTAPVISIRRLGKSETVKLVFSTDTLPEYITIGYSIYKTQPYIEKPRQCSKCNRFEHVRTACTRELRCGRCGGPHDRTKCEAEDPLCMNCNKAHNSTSRLCPAYKREQKIYRYKSEAKVGYTSAKEALRSTQDQMSTGHARTAANQARHDVAAHDLRAQRDSPSTQLSSVRKGKTYSKSTEATAPTLQLKDNKEFPALPGSASTSRVEDKENRQPRRDQSSASTMEQPPMSGVKLQTITNAVRKFFGHGIPL
ncbi:hypothetical protein HPB47_021884 [Ixodes persulcatus]|uniref:Uncharacterized protein n=1 Tax=Ixodes persulcatus TaxID=34615 RepID=A0AC60QEN0_IXOPE|nr:hypothetical protein HPB47_021884 [Ixodes persulcatus]